jgi:hypothetical protein
VLIASLSQRYRLISVAICEALKCLQAVGWGRALASSLEELLAAIGDNPLAPSEPAIRAWCGAAMGEADIAWRKVLEAYSPGQATPGRSLQIDFYWTADGAIDARKSSVSNLEIRDTTAIDSVMRARATAVHAHNAKAFANAI